MGETEDEVVSVNVSTQPGDLILNIPAAYCALGRKAM